MKKRRKGWLIFPAVILLLFLGGKCFLDSLAGDLRTITVSTPNLAVLADGLYVGEYTLGPVHVVAEVALAGGRITEVRLLEHDNGLGKPAEVITQTITQEQSLDVDIVAGATASSKCILKAVEDALTCPAP